MIVDNNLIAYEYQKNQFVPKEVYTSGKRDETSLIDKYRINKKDLPILILEDEIVNKDGYGLRKGFYNVIPDKYLDFLLIYQSGELKAKIPVVDCKIYEPTEEPKKPKKMSYRRYLKEQEKEYRKYLDGENPNEIEWENVEIHYINEENAYLLIYSTNRIELSGVIKF